MVFARRRTAVRRRFAKRRRVGRFAKRRRTSTRRRAVSRGRFGRVANFTPLVRSVPPVAVSKLSRRGLVGGTFLHNIDGGATITRTVKNFVFRANDIVQPTCVDGDTAPNANTWNTSWGSTTRLSALGLNRIAPMYLEHSVYGFGFDFVLKLQALPQVANVLNFFMGWRITDDAPLGVDTDTTPHSCFDQIVNTRGLGWRFKNLRLSSVSQTVGRVKGYIPIRKFYKYPIFTRNEQLELACRTPDTTPTNWTSPQNPCYFQLVIFCYYMGNRLETEVPNQIDGGATGGAAAPTASRAASFMVPYQLKYVVDFYTRSTERVPDVLIQSTTSDGGDDGTADAVETGATLTWSAVDEET